LPGAINQAPETSGWIIQLPVKIIISHTCQVKGPCFKLQASSGRQQEPLITNH